MTESLYLTPESALRLQKFLDHMENSVKEASGNSTLKLQLARHNLYELIRDLPHCSGTRKKAEQLLQWTSAGQMLETFEKDIHQAIEDLRTIYPSADDLPLSKKT